MQNRFSGKRFIKQTYGRAAITVSIAILAMSAVLGGCAAQRQETIPKDDFVEIDNPYGNGDNPDQNVKVWVPRSSLERGLPRGRELLQKGYDKVTGKAEPRKSEVVVIDATTPQAGGSTRIRLLVAEAGDQVVGSTLRNFLGRGSIPKPVARPSAVNLATEQEQLASIATLANLPAGGPILFVSKPEGTKPDARLKADLYDIRGPVLIRSFFVKIPSPAKDQSPESALQLALKGLADATLSSLRWFDWYGRVISVSGERVYIDAGAESGLKSGQKVYVYRGGEVIKGIGFAAGSRIASFPLVDRVGQDGAYGITADADKIKPGDYVELEK
jgi:hypothetical protein